MKRQRKQRRGAIEISVAASKKRKINSASSARQAAATANINALDLGLLRFEAMAYGASAWRRQWRGIRRSA